MIHPDTELVPVHPQIGLGVRATRPIPRGTIVWALDRFDVRLSQEQLAGLPGPWRAVADRYGYGHADGSHIVCWDAGRYVNHSCAPNLRGLGSDAMIAVRDVAAGDEITCDYAECNEDPPMACLCGAPACRGQVSGSDLVRFHTEWDREVAAALVGAGGLEQPLLAYLESAAELRDILAGRRAAPSLITVYRPDPIPVR